MNKHFDQEDFQTANFGECYHDSKIYRKPICLLFILIKEKKTLDNRIVTNIQAWNFGDLAI